MTALSHRAVPAHSSSPVNDGLRAPDKLLRLAEAANHSGVMIAVYPDPKLARQLAIEGFEDWNDLHVTLAYLGDADDLEPDIDDLVQYLVNGDRLLSDKPLEGEISGIGFFTNGDEPVTWASVDVSGLVELQQAVVDNLSQYGVETMSEHGWTPHMTLAYQDLTGLELPNYPLTFGSITVAYAGEKRVIPFQIAKEAAFHENGNEPVKRFLENQLGGQLIKNKTDNPGIYEMNANGIYYQCNIAEDDKEVRIHYLEVDPKGTGAGSDFISLVREYANNLGKSVVVTNPENKGFWGKFDLAKRADYSSVRQKARDIYRAGGVSPITLNPDYAQADVTSTSGQTYLALLEFSQEGGVPRITNFTCECPWGKWNYDRSPEYKYLEHRKCCHNLAFLYFLQAVVERSAPFLRNLQDPDLVA